MHSVVETPVYLASARKAGMTDEEMTLALETVSCSPLTGDLIAGTGGCRKVRIGGRNRGKSGSYRVITYYAGEEAPAFLLKAYSKGQRGNLSRAECNDLAKLTRSIDREFGRRR
jgi:hypothetical protein